jgi:hypothetical protein
LSGGLAAFEDGGRCVLAAIDVEYLQVGDVDSPATCESLCGTGGIAVVVKGDASWRALDRLLVIWLSWRDIVYDDGQSSRRSFNAHVTVGQPQVVQERRDGP